jgi:DNA ligase-1
MLAHPTKSLTEVLDRFDNIGFTCEYKYDGERAQIHSWKEEGESEGKVMVFSRNSENLSGKYPEFPIQMKTVPIEGVESYVLDCEAVAWDKKEGVILPFQVLQGRKRKDVAVEDLAVSVCIFAFDLLYLNGKALTQSTFAERRELMHTHFKEQVYIQIPNNIQPGGFQFATSMDGKSIEDIQQFLEDSVKDSCEGLMVKTLDVDATYQPSNRSRSWLKVKKDYLDGVGDTLDLVVIGGYHGRGKRTGGYGGYLLACYDDDKEEFQSICKRL